MITACTNTPAPSASPEPTQTEEPRQQYEGNSYIQYPELSDYTVSWWEDGLTTSAASRFCVQTGKYGLSLSAGDGMLSSLGAISAAYTQTEAMQQDMSIISALPKVNGDCSVTVDGTEHKRSGIQPPPTSNLVLRIIESGQYMQSFDTAAVEYSGTDVLGRVEIKALPHFFSINYQAFSATEQTVGLKYTISFKDKPEGTLSADGKTLMLKYANGSGLAILSRDGNATQIKYENGLFTAECNTQLKSNVFAGFGLSVIPMAQAADDAVAAYDAAALVTAQAVQIAPKTDKAQACQYDAFHGIMSIETTGMTTASGTAFGNAKYTNAMDRLNFTLTNPTNTVVRIPVLFTKRGQFAVEGMAPVLRNISTGEPIGLPIQVTRNWHAYGTDVKKSDWYKGLDGKWFHGYTIIEIPANSSVNYEFNIAYNTWGTVNSASHSQLCLIGWPNGTTQVWQTSTIGCSGESFCYDPDLTCMYGMINDVRGVGFDPFDNGAKYCWGANNGGGNFLYYGKDGRNSYGNTTEIVGFKNMRVQYRSHGPNLTEVIFNAVTKDDAVKVKFTAFLPRTNDVSRATHTFEYTFLKDVTFERMAFYQFGADNHNSGRWHGLTIGNNDGPITYTLDGKQYGAEAEMPVLDTAGYIGGKGMQRLDVPGDGMWIAYTNSYIGINSDKFQSKNAARMLNVLSFDAQINGKQYNKPSFNIRSSEMFCGDSTQVELCPAAEVGNTIKAGSVVKGAVEYINLPISLSSYYYTSEIIKNIPASEFDTWHIAHRYALGGQTEVTVSKGELLRHYPIKVNAQPDGAELTVHGGISYIPITFAGLNSYAGWQLQKNVDGQWQRVEQAVYGNDYWQTYFDAETGKYEITFNVEHTGNTAEQYTYRLVKA